MPRSISTIPYVFLESDASAAHDRRLVSETLAFISGRCQIVLCEGGSADYATGSSVFLLTLAGGNQGKSRLMRGMTKRLTPRQ